MENCVWDADLFEVSDICIDEINESSREPQESDYPEGLPGHMEPDEALAVCLNNRGCVDMDFIGAMTGLSVPEAAEHLSGEVFQNPETYDREHSAASGWMLREQYLAGNLMRKLETAKEMEKKYHRFGANITALRMAMPEKPDFDSVGLSLGSQWIPPDIYSRFCGEALKLRENPQVVYSEKLHAWKVATPPEAKHAIGNTVRFGTPRITALKIIEHSLNGRIVKIYDRVVRPERSSGAAYVLNRDETLAAQEKQNLLQKEFREWVGKDASRVGRLEKIFYDKYACCVGGRYDGAFLSLPDLNPDIVLFKHQRDAVARIVLSRDVLLNHAVGSGKTYEIIVGLHELNRMGLSEKNMAVVPNNVLHAFEAAHRNLYPEDRILVICPKDFVPAKRGHVLEKIRTEDCAVVYIAFSCFAQIHMSRQYRLDEMEGRVRAARAAAAGSASLWERKALESEAEKLGKQLEKMREELPWDLYTAFDSLGITALAVDESHNFKNITIASRTGGVVGMHAKGSKRCDEMMQKVQFVRTGGGRVIFSTGTPLVNSISDVYTIQRYLQPEQLELLRLGSFDEWISTFAKRQTGFEIDVDSRSFRVMTRFSGFHNLPELTALFGGVCDSYSGENSGMGLPSCAGAIDVVVPKSPEQEEYIDLLVLRTEMIREKLVDPSEDNLLKVTHDGRTAALDIRLAEKEALPDRHETKAYACAKQVYACYRAYPGTAQLVFCDSGTPGRGFNLYDELKGLLTEMGIPVREIAFIHEAVSESAKKRLFSDVNRAAVRVLIGSTPKLGIGVNVQERLVAVHHLDVPWRPADMTQREGRLIRQGNKNAEVFIYRYITAGTFDAYSWQILENKARFISRFMENSLAGREARDISDTVLTYAEIKALAVGDPLLKTRVETANRLERAKVQQRQRERELGRFRAVVRQTPQQLGRLKQLARQTDYDRRSYQKGREEICRENRRAFGEELLYALAHQAGAESERRFDTVHGFVVLLPAWMDRGRPRVVLMGGSGNRYEVDMKGAKPMGCLQRIEYVLLHLDERCARLKQEAEDVRRRRMEAEAAIRQGNPYDAEVAGLTLRLGEIDEELQEHIQGN